MLEKYKKFYKKENYHVDLLKKEVKERASIYGLILTEADLLEEAQYWFSRILDCGNCCEKVFKSKFYFEDIDKMLLKLYKK